MIPRARLTRRALGAACVLVGMTLTARADDPPASAQYVIVQSVLGEAAATSTGAAFRVTGTMGQAGPISASSSDNHVIQSGYWCFLGTGQVPIVLRAVPRPNGEVSLEWTGNESLYEIDRATVCRDIANGFLANTTQKTYTDASPPEARLVCYSVVGG